MEKRRPAGQRRHLSVRTKLTFEPLLEVAGDEEMTALRKKLTGLVLGGTMMLGAAGPLALHADAQRHNSRDYYRDSHGNWKKRHSGIGAGKGALIGGAGGAGVGALLGGGKGALIGGALGAGGGALVGNHNANKRHDQEARYDSQGRRY
jgi:uncharacterized protein YcfJ